MTVQHRQTNRDAGSVTAEFAMALPVVVMILAITLGSLSIQLERMKLVSVASAISRAVGRGEPMEKLQFLMAGHSVAFKNTAEMICAEVSASFRLPGLPGLELPVSDLECARRLGL